MTAKEYIEHYTSGQGGFKSVSVDVALKAIDIAKREAMEQMMKDAVEVQVNPLLGETVVGCKVNGYKVGDKVKLIIIKED